MEDMASLSKTLSASSSSDDRLWRQIEVKAKKKREEVNAKLDDLKHQLLLNKSNKFIVQNFSQIQKNYGYLHIDKNFLRFSLDTGLY